ncbi:MAG: hypothetical protein BGO67_00525 [Alphaproteobacteria bacterium 41-28]|nr:MAG: hypothetical protein BGO67_00525 [Alphaproteobacteria bacterium 41-28]
MKIFHFLTFLILFFLFSLFDTEANAENKETLHEKLSNLSKPNKFFTGREKEITDIAEALLKNNTLVIEGISGIGKTQLAKQYAYACLKKYDLIWWFDSEKNMDTQVDELLAEIFRRENKPYYRPASSLSLAKKLKDRLTFFNSNWLIIFDNVDTISTIAPYVAFENTDSFFKHVIVTSKKMNKTYPSLNIQKFQREESIAFLSKILDGEPAEILNELAETLGDFPLALAQAAGYIKMNPSINVKTYLELFKEGHADLWNAEEKFEKGEKPSHSLKESYRKTISTAIRMNMGSIKDRSPLAYDLLCFCSLLHHHHIPSEILENWACTRRGASKLEFHEALSLLLNYFLLEKEIKSEEEIVSNLFNQHELIQLIIADTIDEDARGIILKEAAECILQELVHSPETLYEQFKGREYFYNHMEKIYRLAGELKENHRSFLELKMALLYFIHFIQHDFDRATALIQPLKNTIENTVLSPLAQVWFHCTIVNDRMFESLSEVEQSYRKGLASLEGIRDKETQIGYLLHLNVDYVESLSNFGRIKEAISVCESLEEILKTTENKAEKIAFLSIAALVRLKHGQHEQALKDVEQCLELISKQKGTENYIPFLMVTKANSLLYQGRIAQAYQVIEDYYPHLLDIYASPECVVLVRAQLIKGACLGALGKVNEAIDVVRQSLGPYEKTSGFGNDSLKGMGYRILGEILEAKGDLAKAFEEYTKAENLYEKILHEKTLDELSILYTRLAILGAKRGDDIMVGKYLSFHIENFGLAHPRTFEIKGYLDIHGLSLP